MNQRDRRARLEALFAEHAGAVHAYALRRSDPETAQDVVGDVFVVAWRRLDDVPVDPLPWLLACARRVLANHRRGARRRNALIDRLRGEPFATAEPAEAGPGPGPGEAEAGPMLRALAELGAGDRELLMLVGWEGLEPARAAAALGCSRATLAVRLHRARRRLAAALERSRQAEPRSEMPTEVLR